MSADDVADKILASVARALSRSGDEVSEDIKRRVSEPYPPASEPNAPPHRRTGGYGDGFTSESEQGGDSASTTISNPTAHGLDNWLEYGTFKMVERPHFRPTFEDWKTKAPARVIEQLRQDFNA